MLPDYFVRTLFCLSASAGLATCLSYKNMARNLDVEGRPSGSIFTIIYDSVSTSLGTRINKADFFTVNM
jgi:hypothetical protein